MPPLTFGVLEATLSAMRRKGEVRDDSPVLVRAGSDTAALTAPLLERRADGTVVVTLPLHVEAAPPA